MLIAFVVLLETRNDSVLKQPPKHASGPACDAFRDLQSCPEYSSIHQTRVERGAPREGAHLGKGLQDRSGSGTRHPRRAPDGRTDGRLR